MKIFFMTPIDSTRWDKPICTLEYLYGLSYQNRSKCADENPMRPNSYTKIQCVLITSMNFVGQSVNTVLAGHTKPNVLYITMLQCRESGEDALANAIWVLRDWGNTTRSPEGKPTGEGGIASISKDEDGIGQCVRARLTVLTLLLSRLEAFDT